ncbi:MAG: hypothetical protein JSV52_10225 [Candidatus Zixiibacteriota bacterium]|nr:MAG: hypothetical protein JSV52_10225 [candidate division Zixibacteria bacterium]
MRILVRRKYPVVGVLLLLAAVLILIRQSGTAGIVHNDGSTGEDSVTVSVINWDSAGCSPISVDSFWVIVLKSNDNDVVFIDSGTTSMEGLDTVRVAGTTVYYFHRAVADVDGSGQYGNYAGELIAKNTTLNLFNSSPFSFQIVGWELDDLGDSAATAWRLYDSLITDGKLLDSLLAVLDTLQNQDEWVSSFNASLEPVLIEASECGEMADTIFGRDSNLFAEGYWHKLASRADSGAAAGDIDSASIAGWVWNTPQENHGQEGTFGKYLDSEVSGIGAGSGLYAHSIVAYDSTISQVVPGVRLAVRNLDQTSLLAVGITGTNGKVSFNLDADDYLVVGSATGYLFQPYRTITVPGSPADTVYGARFDPGLPSSPGLCRVYGHIYDLTGAPESGVTVTAAMPAGVHRFGGLIVTPNYVSTSTDADGYFLIDLIPSELLTPSGSVYEFTISRPDGTILRQRTAVPNQTTWQLTW